MAQDSLACARTTAGSADLFQRIQSSDKGFDRDAFRGARTIPAYVLLQTSVLPSFVSVKASIPRE